MLHLYIIHGMTPDATGGLTLTSSPRGEAALFMGSLAQSPWPLPPEIACPVLVIEGEDSEGRKHIDLPQVASVLPNGSHRFMAHAGHLMVMEKPAAVTGIIREFLP